MQKKPTNIFEVKAPQQIFEFLLEIFPQKSRSNIKKLLSAKQIMVDNEIVTHYGVALQVGQKVEVLASRPNADVKLSGLTIIYEDAHIVVINKQEGTLSISTDKNKDQNAYSTLSTHVKKANPKNRIFVVHRLDRETSGLMMFAKSEEVQEILQSTWGPTTKERIYLAVTEGSPREKNGEIRSYLQETKALKVYSVADDTHGGQYAVTFYETLKTSKRFSLMKVYLETGRKNQVRVHMQDIGTPIVGDKKYGATTNPIGRLGLHAWVLAFKHPISGESMRFETAVPKKFSDLF